MLKGKTREQIGFFKASAKYKIQNAVLSKGKMDDDLKEDIRTNYYDNGRETGTCRGLME